MSGRGCWGLFALVLFVCFALPQRAAAGPFSFPLVPVRPALAQSVSLIGADAAHELGITGAGVGVAVVDIFEPNPADPCRSAHGAWVEGVVRGVAPEADVFRYPVRTYSRGGDGCFVMHNDDINRALEEILAQHDELGIRVVNLSWGGGAFDRPCHLSRNRTEALIERLAEAGVVVVAAAGNEGLTDALIWPACLDGVVSVGAVYDYDGTQPEFTPVCAQVAALDRVACYSNAAPFMDLLAPGSVIEVPGGMRGLGTSAAAPHAAGTFALLFQAGPALGAHAARERPRRTGKVVRDPRTGQRFPRVDALAVVRSALGAEAGPANPPAPPDEPAFERGDVNGDGALDTRDVLLLLAALGGVRELSASQAHAADVAEPCDGAPTLADLDLLKRAALGRGAFECGEAAGPQALRPLTVRVEHTVRAVRFALSAPAEAARVRVFDLSGRILFDSGMSAPDALRWDLTDARGARVPNGVYFYAVRVRDGAGTRSLGVNKLVVLH